MGKIQEILENPFINKSIRTLIIIIVSFCLHGIVKKIIGRHTEKNLKVLTGKKTQTYVNLIKSLIKYTFVGLTVLVILQTWGININSIIAGVGILGAIFGLAIQDWLKDIIRGSSILSDNYFSVGDIVKYKDIEGKVLELGLKTTKIQALRTNNVISIANRNIDQIEIVSNVIFVRVPMSYDVPVKKGEKVVSEIIEKIKESDKVKDCIYKGIAELGASSVQYLIQITCDTASKLQVERDALKIVLLTLEENKLEVPYNQIDVHQK